MQPVFQLHCNACRLSRAHIASACCECRAMSMSRPGADRPRAGILVGPARPAFGMPIAEWPVRPPAGALQPARPAFGMPIAQWPVRPPAGVLQRPSSWRLSPGPPPRTPPPTARWPQQCMAPKPKLTPRPPLNPPPEALLLAARRLQTHSAAQPSPLRSHLMAAPPRPGRSSLPMPKRAKLTADSAGAVGAGAHQPVGQCLTNRPSPIHRQSPSTPGSSDSDVIIVEDVPRISSSESDVIIEELEGLSPIVSTDLEVGVEEPAAHMAVDSSLPRRWVYWAERRGQASAISHLPRRWFHWAERHGQAPMLHPPKGPAA